MVRRGGRTRLCYGWPALLLLAAAPAFPAAAGDQPIIVIAPGDDMGLDGAGTDIVRTGRPDVLASLTRHIPGLTLQDAQNNPWQPNLVYRGFVASPLQGQAQGLAAYLDGARFNQPFGDTMGFDLIPSAAIRQIDLVEASPVYGLNALGGALILQGKTGQSDPGIAMDLSAGRFGDREGNLTAGFARNGLSGFFAIGHRREAGWRDFSPSRLTNAYLDLGHDGDGAGVHVKLIGADTDLTGNGVAPVELLAARRRAVFTWPDNSRSRYGRISLHPWVRLSGQTRLEASLYGQWLTLRNLNGDAADIEPCESDAGLLCLEAGDTQMPLTNAQGAVIPVAGEAGEEGPYAVLNRGRTRTRAGGLLVQMIDRRALGGGENRLVLGYALDASRTDFRTSTELGMLNAARGVDGLGEQIVQGDGAIAPVHVVAHSRYHGLFAQNHLPLSAQLTAEFSLRYNHADIRMVDQIGTALNGRHRFHRLNPGVALAYALSQGTELRLGYAQTNRAPTPAELSCADENAPCSLTNFFVADPPLRQVIARSWTLGAKGRAARGDWTLDWRLSAYRTTSDDDIQYIASQVRGRAYFQNIGQTRRQGADVHVRLENRQWQLMLGYAYTDARFRTPHIRTSPANPGADADGLIAVKRGDILPGVPRHSMNLSVDYQGKGWRLGGDVLARSGQYLAGDEANLTAPVGGYALVNLRGGVDIGPGVALFGEVRNLFDRDYASFGTFSEVDEIDLAEAPGASNPRAYGPGAPRRWMLGIKAGF